MHVFISYAKKDTHEIALDLARTLHSRPNLTAWMDKVLVAGDSWAAQIQDEISRADLVMVLLSPDINRPRSAMSGGSFVIKEINYAQSLHKPILPVMVMPTHLPVQIADLQYIDLSSDYDSGKAQLITHLRQLAQSLQNYRRGSQPRPRRFRPRSRLVPRIGRRMTLGLVAVVVAVVALLLTVDFPDDNDAAKTTIHRADGSTTTIIRDTGDSAKQGDVQPKEFDMVEVPPGCYSPGPGEEVCIGESYWIDRTEVSREQYDVCVMDDGCPAAPTHEDSHDPQQPVTGLTWEEAQLFCEWRDARLPNEQEWEYAAKGPDNLIYPWGNEFDADVVSWEGYSWPTVNVDMFEAGASWVGALQMAGNVWEYVDVWEDEPPEGFVLRGGSYISKERELTTAARYVMPFDFDPREHAFAGFRCLAETPP
jgi:hypothetical protein